MGFIIGQKPPVSAGWGVRNTVQTIVLLGTLALGIQFAVYVHQAAGAGPVTVSRPPGVEGFLPIGALMGWAYFARTGIWDTVHPAAMVILAVAAALSFLLRKSFCSWLCPVGTLSEGLWRLGEKITGSGRRLPGWVDTPLRGLKYALLGFFVWVIAGMSLPALEAFLQSSYYAMADVKMLQFFTRMTAATAVVLAVLILLSLVFRNFWCRYLCPYGALMGIFAVFSPIGIRRDPAACIDCGQCRKACPALLPVDRKARIASAECTGCMDCVAICPVTSAVTLRTRGTAHRWRPVVVAVAVAAIFAGGVTAARISGHWASRVNTTEFRSLLRSLDGSDGTHTVGAFRGGGRPAAGPRGKAP